MKKMKYIAFTVIFLFFLAGSVKCQVFDTYYLSLSGNYTTVHSKTFDDFRHYNSGGGFSIEALKELNSVFKIKSGLDFQVQRFDVKVNNEIFVVDNSAPEGYSTAGWLKFSTTSNIYLLSIPVLLEAKMPFKFSTYAGPRLDFKLGSKNGSTNYMYLDSEEYFEDEIPERAEFFVLGWTVGIGRAFNVLGMQPRVGFQYNGDFMDLLRSENTASMRKRSFNIRLSVPVQL